MRAPDGNGNGHDPTEIDDVDLDHLRRTVQLAHDARQRGDHPFGSLLVTADGTVVEALNNVNTGADPTGHAETNLVRLVGARFDQATLAASVLYTSTEPCAMCSGAIFWAGIRRVVFALAEGDLRAMVEPGSDAPTLALPCREVFARGGHPVAVAGPAAIDEATTVHAGFWS